MSYDSAQTIFSPQGELLQVDYATQAAKLGQPTIGILCNDCVLYGISKPSINKLQIPNTVSKIHRIDANCTTAYTGLNADGRVVMNRARVEAQSFKLNYDDDPSIEYMAKYIASIFQKMTQTGGTRPFGIGVLISGMSAKDGRPKLFQVLPGGMVTEYKANCIGKGSEAVVEKLKQKYKDDMTREEGMQLMMRCLYELVDNPKQNGEIGIVDANGLSWVSEENRARLADLIEEENNK